MTTPASFLPADLNNIITDVDLQEEGDKRLQEEKDAVSVVHRLFLIIILGGKGREMNVKK